MPSQLQINHIADFDVHHSEEALVPLLEFALVEDLDCNHGGVLDSTRKGQKGELRTLQIDSDRKSKTRNSHIKTFVPVGVEGLLHDTSGVRLLGIDGDDGEGVREAEDLPFREAIGGDDWV